VNNAPRGAAGSCQILTQAADRLAVSAEDGSMDWKLELVPVPVSDPDRAIAFYAGKVGFHLDHDHVVSEGVRFVQLTPPGSACSISLGKGLVDSAPGSLRGLQLVVSDIHQARAHLVERGVEVGEVKSFPWGEFVFFADPDGNTWSVQQIPAHLLAGKSGR
jgi:catechol 2,3-dioxygenase-like lactoylglutathione lyase family enzyme